MLKVQIWVETALCVLRPPTGPHFYTFSEKRFGLILIQYVLQSTSVFYSNFLMHRLDIKFPYKLLHVYLASYEEINCH